MSEEKFVKGGRSIFGEPEDTSPQAESVHSAKIKETIAYLQSVTDELRKEEIRLCINVDGTDPEFAIRKQSDYEQQLEVFLGRVKLVRSEAKRILGSEASTYWSEHQDETDELVELSKEFWKIPSESEIEKAIRKVKRGKQIGSRTTLFLYTNGGTLLYVDAGTTQLKQAQSWQQLANHGRKLTMRKQRTHDPGSQHGLWPDGDGAWPEGGSGIDDVEAIVDDVI